MALANLANELLIQIISYLPQQEVNAITQSNRQFYSLFNTYLYTQDIQQNNSRALLWASEHGREGTIYRLLNLGADLFVKTTTSQEYQCRYHFKEMQWNIPVNSLWVACITGQAGCARILLEASISDNDYAKERESFPLYYALGQGHDDVALVLLEHFSDIELPMAWSSTKSKPLHLVCYLGLPSLVRLLIEKGANIHAEDGNGLTALHYALLHPSTCRRCFDSTMQGMGNTVKFTSRGEGFAADAEVVRLLLEKGADMDKIVQHGPWSHRHSPMQLAWSHPDENVRKLCGADGGWMNRLRKWKYSQSTIAEDP